MPALAKLQHANNRGAHGNNHEQRSADHLALAGGLVIMKVGEGADR